MSSPTPLLNVTVAVPVDGGVKNHQLKPTAQWYYESISVGIDFISPFQVG